MLIHQGDHSCHLTYCLNVHPGESWQEQFQAVQTYPARIKKLLGITQDFGLGLRFSASSAAFLRSHPAAIAEMRDFCAGEGLYPFTVNAFPYGEFHRQPVKRSVYLPDWSSPERLQYSLDAAAVLAQLLPAGLSWGSISTMPLAYRGQMSTQALYAAIMNLDQLVSALQILELESGKHISFGLEPEPDCLLDSCSSTVNFFEQIYWRYSRHAREVSSRYLGVCLDTCHQGVLGESPADCLQKFSQAGISLAKVQLSAAPVFDRSGLSQAESFQDQVYLHQCSVRLQPGSRQSIRFPDLPEGLYFARQQQAPELRTHFHIPLTAGDDHGRSSTRTDLDDNFFRQIARQDLRHLELETYTFAVLPQELRQLPLEQCLAADLNWCRNKLQSPADDNGKDEKTSP
ncbi:MAG: metabolite traffic protein EboE [Oligosphaeraceae bacterium]|nr:metabolite traffic protein EboE [Oligosphaeraceae bacterium]